MSKEHARHDECGCENSQGEPSQPPPALREEQHDERRDRAEADAAKCQADTRVCDSQPSGPTGSQAVKARARCLLIKAKMTRTIACENLLAKHLKQMMMGRGGRCSKLQAIGW
jgi:hypothetical protein